MRFPALLAIGLCLFTSAEAREQGRLLESMRAPAVPFDASPHPPAPDYSRADAWAARPDTSDAADINPKGVEAPSPDSLKADVFFVHPTSYFGNAWNAAVDDHAVNEKTDSGSIRNQASVFNGCCRVFAPRYRQAALSTFFTRQRADAEKAWLLAYEDVRRAFAHYVAHDNGGRPFIIASHSQGSRYALWLLQDAIEGSALRQRFVGAYIVGFAIPQDWFDRNLKTIGVCGSATERGCVASWSSYEEGARADRSRFKLTHRYATGFESNEGKSLVCTNPLSWVATTAAAPAALNLGAWAAPRQGGPAPAPRPAVTGARCDNGALFVRVDSGQQGAMRARPGGNDHILDYQLFYMNIRKNAQERVHAWIESR